jgi:Na+/melibiose symporter-like transporter
MDNGHLTSGKHLFMHILVDVVLLAFMIVITDDKNARDFLFVMTAVSICIACCILICFCLAMREVTYLSSLVKDAYARLSDEDQIEIEDALYKKGFCPLILQEKSCQDNTFTCLFKECNQCGSRKG